MHNNVCDNQVTLMFMMHNLDVKLRVNVREFLGRTYPFLVKMFEGIHAS